MRPHGEGKGTQGFGKRAESTQLRFYEKDPREGAGAGRGRAGPGLSKDYEASDSYGRDSRGGGTGSRDRNRSKSSERRGKGRDIDKDVMRARRKVSGGGTWPPETPSRRQDEGQRTESPASGPAGSKSSPGNGTSVTPMKGTGLVTEQPLGGAGDGSATRARGVQSQPPPLAGNALSSAYDHLPMPTSSLEFHPSMGGDDFFSSLEDQLSDPVMRASYPSVASPLRRSSRSSSMTSPTGPNFVASPTKSGGVSGASGGGGVGDAAERAASAVAAPSASAPTSIFSASALEPASTATMNRPEAVTAKEVLDSGSGIAPMDGSTIQGEEEQNNDLKCTTNTTNTKRKALPSAPPSLSPPPPPPPEEPPVPWTDAVEVEDAGPSVASRKTSLRRQEHVPACPPVQSLSTADGGVKHRGAAEESASAVATAATSTETAAASAETRTAGKTSDGKAATASSASGEQNAAAATDGVGSSSSGGAGVTATGGDGGLLGQTDMSTPQHTKARSETGGDDAAIERENQQGEGGEEEEEEDGERLGEGSSAQEAKEDEENTGEEKPRCSAKKSPWYTEGTMVVLDCDPEAKSRVSHPTVPIVDLLDRPVRGVAFFLFLHENFKTWITGVCFWSPMERSTPFHRRGAGKLSRSYPGCSIECSTLLWLVVVCRAVIPSYCPNVESGLT